MIKLKLTPRQAQISDIILDSPLITNKQIAKKLKISENTVKVLIRQVFMKAGNCHSKTEFAKLKLVY